MIPNAFSGIMPVADSRQINRQNNIEFHDRNKPDNQPDQRPA